MRWIRAATLLTSLSLLLSACECGGVRIVPSGGGGGSFGGDGGQPVHAGGSTGQGGEAGFGVGAGGASGGGGASPELRWIEVALEQPAIASHPLSSASCESRRPRWAPPTTRRTSVRLPGLPFRRSGAISTPASSASNSAEAAPRLGPIFAVRESTKEG